MPGNSAVCLAFRDPETRQGRAAAGLQLAFEVRQPGRSTTAIGTRSVISRQRCQRWNVARLSAPMTQPNPHPPASRRAPGSALSRTYRSCRYFASKPVIL